MNNIGKKVRIKWNDALAIFPKRKGDNLFLKKEDTVLSPMETTGILTRDYEDYVIVENPITINKETKKRHPEKDPTFYMIPRGMIISVEEI